MKALVISGGGAKGAYGGGIAQYLIEEQKNKYDIFIGSSTGSLLLPFLAMGNIALAKQVFTSVCPKEIFKISPFKFKKVNGVYETRINHWNSLISFLKRRSSFGDSSNLRKLIERSFTKEHFNKIRYSHKEVIVTVANFTKLEKEYKSIHENSYDDFCDWMWASANLVPFMSLMNKNGFDYADGGFGDYLPVHKALDMGAQEVDSIYLDLERPNITKPIIKTPFDTLMRSIEFMMNRIAEDDIEISTLQSEVKKTSKVFIYFLDKNLTDNSLFFDKEQMNKWWQEGLEYGRSHQPKSLSIKPKLAQKNNKPAHNR